MILERRAHLLARRKACAERGDPHDLAPLGMKNTQRGEGNIGPGGWTWKLAGIRKTKCFRLSESCRNACRDSQKSKGCLLAKHACHEQVAERLDWALDAPRLGGPRICDISCRCEVVSLFGRNPSDSGLCSRPHPSGLSSPTRSGSVNLD